MNPRIGPGDVAVAWSLRYDTRPHPASEAEGTASRRGGRGRIHPERVMVATNEGRNTNSRSKKRTRGRTTVSAADNGARATVPASAAVWQDSQADRRVPPPREVRGREAARRILELAALSETLDVRNRLRRLGMQVQGGGRDAQRMTFVEATIGECLDEAEVAASQRDRWLSCEAATWAVGWMARTRRAGGSAGSLLERLVRAAHAAATSLAAGDTLPACFVLTLARLFRDIEACRCLEESATVAVGAEVDRLVSAAGVVNLADSAAMVDRVVRWTQFRDIASATGGACWSDATDGRWQTAAVAALRLLGHGARAFAGAGRLPDCFTAPLVDAMEGMGGRCRRTARALATGAESCRRRDVLPRDLHDAEAAVAIVRSGWARDSLRVMLDYRTAVPRLEIAVGERMLVNGPWEWGVTCDGVGLEAESAWRVSGWETGRKGTFLEIAASLGGGLQIERQLVVLPEDRIVLLADAIVSATAGGCVGDLRYRVALPLAPSLDAEAGQEHREVVVFDTSMRFMALPLALPEWRTAGRGVFEVAGQSLTLTQEGRGGLYAPLWIDCDASRVGGPLTWRQLTVADTRCNIGTGQAAGFRVQAGLRQWLLYRSLDTPRNRTLLGCNVSSGFLLGRIKRSGEVARTLEID